MPIIKGIEFGCKGDLQVQIVSRGETAGLKYSRFELSIFQSSAAQLKNGQSDQIKTIEFERKRGMDSYLKKKLDEINRIIMIMRLSAEKPLAAGEKNPDDPVDPV